jgi:uncharacterized protein (DUF433 family)
MKMQAMLELADRISKLPLSEREELLHRLADSDASSPAQLVSATPLITKTPGICGGSARIIRTRIPVWTLQAMRQRGITEAEILRSYPTLRAVDLVQAWMYADTHHDEVEREIRENEED